MTLPGENSLTLKRISWAEFKKRNNLLENSYLELLYNRIDGIIKEHGQTGSRSS